MSSIVYFGCTPIDAPLSGAEIGVRMLTEVGMVMVCRLD